MLQIPPQIRLLGFERMMSDYPNSVSIRNQVHVLDETFNQKDQRGRTGYAKRRHGCLPIFYTLARQWPGGRGLLALFQCASLYCICAWIYS